MAPGWTRTLLAEELAASTIVMESWAPDWLRTSMARRLANWLPAILSPSAVDATLFTETLTVWWALAPIWNTRGLLLVLTFPCAPVTVVVLLPPAKAAETLIPEAPAPVLPVRML